MELQQVLYPQGLEQQHHVGKVSPLDLGHGGGQELVLVSTLCVESAREKPMTGLHLPCASLSRGLATLRNHPTNHSRVSSQQPTTLQAGTCPNHFSQSPTSICSTLVF